MGEYNIKIEHREGKNHGNADCQSRQGMCKQCGKILGLKTEEFSSEPAVKCSIKSRPIVRTLKYMTLTPG